ncbi:MAG TPA: hypothetical protein QGI72_04425 [Poseidonia sp.]|nr:hypothetical protein [Poseidonia sp.]
MEENPAQKLSGFEELLDDPTTNKITAGLIAFFLVFLGINSFDLMANNDNVRSIIDGDSDWTISFEEEIVTLSDSVIVGDGDTETMEFSIDESLLSDGFYIGGFSIQLTYTETSGIPADPADSVFTTLVQNDFAALWDDENNTKSGSSTDGSSIDLYLRAYEGYDGSDKNMTGYNEIQVLGPWIVSGQGIGTLSLDVSVETSALAFTTDNEEEVNITVSIITFKPTAIN